MNYVLADTSVWIDFLNDVKQPHVETFAVQLSNSIICICPPILHEVLQGIRDDAMHQQMKEYLLGLEVLSIDPVKAAIEAAAMYRHLRKKGVTIRKSNDCLIAHYAINSRIELLHNDADFDHIAKHTALLIFKA